MLKLLAILLIGLVCEAVGVVFLSKALKQIGEVREISISEILRLIKVCAMHPGIWKGMFFETLFFGTLLFLMSKGDVSFVWPLTALSFVLTTLAAKFYLGEQVSALRWFGISLIMVGAGLITWSEKSKPKSIPTRPPAVTLLSPRVPQ